jgi:flagellar motor switch protein FliG
LIFQKLNSYKEDEIFQVLQGESSQTIAIVLSRLNSIKAKNVLKNFPLDQQKDIVYRMATSASKIHSEVLNQIAKAIQEKIKLFDEPQGSQIGGSEKLAKILNILESKTGKNILSEIEKKDASLASKIKDKMFTFNDILKIENNSLKKALFEINNDIIALALKDESEEMKQKFLNNISDNRKKLLLIELKTLGPQKRSNIEDAKNRILETLREMQENGELFFKNSNKKDEWV